MVDADDQPAFEATLVSPDGGGPNELHVTDSEAALASHVVSIDDHGARAARKLDDSLLKRLQLTLQARALPRSCWCPQSVHVQGLKHEQRQYVAHTLLPFARPSDRHDARSRGSRRVGEAEVRAPRRQLENRHFSDKVMVYRARLWFIIVYYMKS